MGGIEERGGKGEKDILRDLCAGIKRGENAKEKINKRIFRQTIPLKFLKTLRVIVEACLSFEVSLLATTKEFHESTMLLEPTVNKPWNFGKLRKGRGGGIGRLKCGGGGDKIRRSLITET